MKTPRQRIKLEESRRQLLEQWERAHSTPQQVATRCRILLLSAEGKLLLNTELKRRMKFANLQCEWAQVIRGLKALQQVEATFQDKRFVLRSQLTSEASAALRATGVAAPPRCARSPNRLIERKCSAKGFWRFHKYLI
jgi:hypothetical protein